MEPQLSLEERAVGYLLTGKSQFCFLDMACFYGAKYVVERAVKKGDYNIKSALLSVVSDPRDMGKTGYAFIDGSTEGVISVQSLMFYHELSSKLGIQSEIDKHIQIYVEKWAEYWESRIEELSKDSQMQGAFEQQKDKLEALRNCTNPKFIANPKSPAYPLLEGDRKIMDILASLTPENLQKYAKKYVKK